MNRDTFKNVDANLLHGRNVLVQRSLRSKHRSVQQLPSLNLESTLPSKPSELSSRTKKNLKTVHKISSILLSQPTRGSKNDRISYDSIFKQRKKERAPSVAQLNSVKRYFTGGKIQVDSIFLKKCGSTQNI